MRSRNIKPDFFTNDQLLACEDLARILFAGLWCMADRRGRLEDRPTKIKIKLLPCSNCDIKDLLNQLERNDLILRYEAKSRRYIQVINFEKHQNPHHKEPESIIPAPDLDVMLASSMTQKPGTSPRYISSPSKSVRADSLIPDSLIPESSLSSDDARAHEPQRAKPKKQIPNLSRLPFDSLPPEWAEWVHAEMGWNADTTADVWLNFRDYWQGKLGKVACKSDWGATWRNWCRRQHFSNKGTHHETAIRYTSQGSRPSKSEQFKRVLINTTLDELSAIPEPGGAKNPI